MEEENEKMTEREFQCYRGWEVPPILRLVWTILIIWALAYFFMNVIPDLKSWIKK